MKIEAASRLVMAEQSWKYFDRLVRLGIKKLGQGHFSTVFQHPTMPNVAVKLAVMDEGWAYKWTKWCKANPNPYVPKVYDIHKVELEEDEAVEYYLVFMEKLKEAAKTNVELFIRDHELERVLVNVGTVGSPHWRLETSQLAAVKDTPLRKLLTIIDMLGDGSRGDIGDMRPQNFMMRGHQLVFTDPVAH